MTRKGFALPAVFLLAVIISVAGYLMRERISGYISGGYLTGSPGNARLELQGNVEIREVRLGFEVSGRITRMSVEEGDIVTPGMTIAELDPTYLNDALYQAEGAMKALEAELERLQKGSRVEEIAQAKANTLVAKVSFQNAQREFERARDLLPDRVISQEEFDKAREEMDSAEARLIAQEALQKLIENGSREEDIRKAHALAEQSRAKFREAEHRLQDSVLVSPVKGFVQTRIREQGDFVNVGEAVYTIALTDPVWVRTYVNGSDLENIRPGMKAEIVTDTGKLFSGQVGYISPAAEFSPKTVQTREVRTDLVYRIRVTVDDPEGDLRQGMPVTVCVIIR